MATNHQYHRRSHEALLRKRRLAQEPVEDSVAAVEAVEGRETVEGEKERRQFGIDLPFFPPVTDLFPPFIPGRPRPTTTAEEETTSSTVPTSSTVIPVIPTTSSTPTPVVPPTTTTPTTTSTPTTSSTPVVVVSSTTSTPPPVPTTSSTPLPAVTITSYVRSSARPTASNAAANGELEATGGSKAGPIVGGIFGGLAGIAVIALIVVLVMRRRRKRELESFDPADFRRSAMLMPDPPTHEDTVSQGFNPPPSAPPAMMERGLPPAPGPNYGVPAAAPVPLHHDYGYPTAHMSPPPPSGYYGNQYADPAPVGHNFAGMGSQGMAGVGAQSWAPGQVIPVATHYAANPFMNPAPYNESPFSPVQSTASPPPPSGPVHTPHYPVGFPTTSAQSSPQNEVPPNGGIAGQRGEDEAPATVLAQIGGAAILTRAASHKSKASGGSGSGKSGDLSISVPALPSGANVVAVNYPELPSRTSTGSVDTVSPANKRDSEAIPADDYVDLTRASVSPFQAAQYAEISKRLNTETPAGMPSPMVDQYVNAQDRDLPPLPPPSPLTPAAPSPQQFPSDATIRDSVDSMASITNARSELGEFPIPPPSPAFLTVSKHRIDSMPPRLPEITVESRVSVGSYATYENMSSRGHGGSSNGHDMDVTYDYHKSYSGPLSAGGNGHMGPAFPSGVSGVGASPLAAKFAPGPSPLAGNFTVPATPKGPSGLRQEVSAEEDQAGQKDDAAQLQRSPSAKAEIVAGKKKERPETVYDPEDAYGGI